MEIYFDNSATTRVLPEVAALVTDVMLENYGNPSSLHHKGFTAEQAIAHAREQIAASLNVRSDELFFVSCGSEGNNLAVLGVAEAYKRQGKRVIISAIEHSSVLGAAEELRRRGFDVAVVMPQQDGTISAEDVVALVTEDTILVSVMLVNSETGAINDISAIAAAVKRKNPKTLVHSDCVQGYGKLMIAPVRWKVDLITVSGHKICAPKGVAALYRKKGVKVTPLYFGSSQESGLHPGTENVPAICGMGLAAEIMQKNLKAHQQHFVKLHDYIYEKIENIPELCINSPANGAHHIMNVSAVGIRSEIMIHYLEQFGIYLSSGSACSRGAKSHVLTAMKLAPNRIDSALRISFNIHNTTDEIAFFVDKLTEGLNTIARAK